MIKTVIGPEPPIFTRPGRQFMSLGAYGIFSTLGLKFEISFESVFL